MNVEPGGPYVMQVFGTVGNPGLEQRGRLYGVRGIDSLVEARVEGLTKDEAVACMKALRELRGLPPEPVFTEIQ
jgi:uncharacterized protein YunC (DUF1805 family)